MLQSCLCTYERLTSERFIAWAELIRRAWDLGPSPGGPVYLHRKLWEWVFILEALDERGLLSPGRRGLGFGVGQDPIASVLASRGVSVVATDVDLEHAADAGWTTTGQHASSLAELNQHGLCEEATFRRLVEYRTVDMNHIPSDLRDFDFTWSACAFEHLGSLEHGIQFVLRQMDCLKKGGFAVHTTEFNLSSNRETIESSQLVLYRRRDIERLVSELTADNHIVEVDYSAGRTPADLHVDAPPFSETHLKVCVSGFATTSLGLIVEKNPWAIEERTASKRTDTTGGGGSSPWSDNVRAWLEEGRLESRRALRRLRRQFGAGQG